MDLIKVRFLRFGMPSGREYTYRSEVEVKVDNIVELPHPVPQPEGTPYNRGVVTQVNVPEEEVEAFKDKVKTIIGVAPVQEDAESEDLSNE